MKIKFLITSSHYPGIWGFAVPPKTSVSNLKKFYGISNCIVKYIDLTELEYSRLTKITKLNKINNANREK